MKHNDLTLNSRQAEKLYFALYLLVLIIGLLLFDSCTPAKVSQGPGSPEQWKEFNACIEAHPSDSVCDSCYTVIFNANK